MSVGRRLLSERVCDSTGLVQALHPILHAHGVQQGDEEVLAAYAVAEAAAEGGAYRSYRAVLATALRDLGAL